ncbi:sterol desaturase family protein [Nocardioides sp. W3-2-3]|nr:sterol desaturase family protein [Nocardioides convexus]
MGLISLAFTLAFKVGSFLVYTLAFVHLAPFHLPTDAWWYWPLVLVAVDLGFYGSHRFVHRVNVGWAAHQAHHSSEYMNFGTALRQKWNPWFEFFFWLPLPFLGFSPWTIYVAFGVNLVFQFFVHTETIGRLPRPIEPGLQHPVAPPGAPRLGPGVPRQELRRDAHRLGPDARHLPGRACTARRTGSRSRWRPTTSSSLQYGDYAQITRNVRNATSLARADGLPLRAARLDTAGRGSGVEPEPHPSVPCDAR